MFRQKPDNSKIIELRNLGKFNGTYRGLLDNLGLDDDEWQYIVEDSAYEDIT